MRNRAMAQPLKESKAYKDAREAALVRLAIETPDCHYQECSDCCFLDLVDSFFVKPACPECEGKMTLGWIKHGEVMTK